MHRSAIGRRQKTRTTTTADQRTGVVSHGGSMAAVTNAGNQAEQPSGQVGVMAYNCVVHVCGGTEAYQRISANGGVVTVR